MNTYDIISNKIEELLKNPTNWEKNWFPRKSNFAKNIHTNNVYSGFLNQIILNSEIINKNYSCNNWLSFKQIAEEKGSVKKGEKATDIFFTSFLFFDENGNKINEDDYSKNVIKNKKVPFLKTWKVFNVNQTENLPAHFFEVQEEEIFNNEERNFNIDNFVLNTGAKIDYLQANRCYYNRKNDKISMVRFENFDSAENFYLTQFHELGHWTGHFDRLNRKFGEIKGNKDYAFEELVAELTSAFIGSNFDLNKQIGNSANYINSWLSALKNDKKFFVQAVALAQQSANFLIDLVDKNKLKKIA